MVKVTAQEVVDKIGIICKIVGDPTAYFSNIKKIGDESNQSIIWISSSNKDKAKIIEKTSAKVVITDITDIDYDNIKATLIIVNNPRLAFTRVMNLFFSVKHEVGIHPRATIHPDSEIGNNCYIGPNTIVGKCKIDDFCRVMGNVTIYDNVKIGKNTVVHSGSVLGVDGFGFQINDKNIYEKIGHIGGVVIGSEVEIGSNVSIARSALSNTIIKNGVKINNNVHIAHNVVVSDNVVITANATICGSVFIGKNAWIGPSATIINSINIGDFSILGSGAVLTKDMPKNQTWAGVPAKLLNSKK